MSEIQAKVILSEESQHVAEFSEEDCGAIAYIQLDPEKKRIVGTDAKALVLALLMNISCGNEPFLVHGETLANAIRCQKKFGHRIKKEMEIVSTDEGVEISFTDSNGHRMTFAHPHYAVDDFHICKKFPEVDSLIPSKDDGVFAISLHPKLLTRIATHAMKCDEDCRLNFVFHASDSAVLITAEDSMGVGKEMATYVLMPMHDSVSP